MRKETLNEVLEILRTSSEARDIIRSIINRNCEKQGCITIAYNKGLCRMHYDEYNSHLKKMFDRSDGLSPCRFCGEHFQLQTVTVDKVNPERDLIKCRICKSQAPREQWNNDYKEKS